MILMVEIFGCRLGMCCVQSAKSSNVSHSQITMMVKSCPFEIFVFPFSGSLFTIHRNSLMKWEKPFIHPCYLSVPLIFPMKSWMLECLYLLIAECIYKRLHLGAKIIWILYLYLCTRSSDDECVSWSYKVSKGWNAEA